MSHSTATERDDLHSAASLDERPAPMTWSQRLVYFLRAVAVLSMIKGLYHWAVVCGFIGAGEDGFAARDMPWQSATAFFAVFDLVAAVGLWLASPWGAVVWLTSSISLIALILFFPQVYGMQVELLAAATVLIGAYLTLAILAAREG